MCTDSGLLNYGEHLVPVKCIYPTPGDIGCCPFCGEGSVVVNHCLLLLLPLFLGVLCLVLVLLFNTLCLSSFAIILMRKRELIVLLYNCLPYAL